MATIMLCAELCVLLARLSVIHLSAARFLHAHLVLTSVCNFYSPLSAALAYRAHPQGAICVTDAMLALGLPPGSYHYGDLPVTVFPGSRCATDGSGGFYLGPHAVVSGTQTLAGTYRRSGALCYYYSHAVQLVFISSMHVLCSSIVLLFYSPVSLSNRLLCSQLNVRSQVPSFRWTSACETSARTWAAAWTKRSIPPRRTPLACSGSKGKWGALCEGRGRTSYCWTRSRVLCARPSSVEEGGGGPRGAQRRAFHLEVRAQLGYNSMRYS